MRVPMKTAVAIADQSSANCSPVSRPWPLSSSTATKTRKTTLNTSRARLSQKAIRMGMSLSKCRDTECNGRMLTYPDGHRERDRKPDSTCPAPKRRLASRRFANAHRQESVERHLARCLGQKCFKRRTNTGLSNLKIKPCPAPAKLKYCRPCREPTTEYLANESTAHHPAPDCAQQTAPAARLRRLRCRRPLAVRRPTFFRRAAVAGIRHRFHRWRRRHPAEQCVSAIDHRGLYLCQLLPQAFRALGMRRLVSHRQAGREQYGRLELLGRIQTPGQLCAGQSAAGGGGGGAAGSLWDDGGGVVWGDE